ITEIVYHAVAGTEAYFTAFVFWGDFAPIRLPPAKMMFSLKVDVGTAVDEPAPITYTCRVCSKQGESAAPGRQLCPACHEEFERWLRGVLQPLCKLGEDPLKKLYCFPKS